MGNTVHILPWFLFSSKSILTFFTVDANTQKLQIQTFSKIKASLVDLIAQYKAYKKALGETNLSISDFIKWLISGQAQIDATKLKILALRGAALLLNMALGVVTGLVVSSLIGAITSYAQRIDTAATKTKEAADAANNTTSSLKDLVDAYEELGDKSGWSTEDFDQAKDIQEELLALAKEQGTLDENKANQLDLQNGKYEEQLGLLKDITEEQLKASESKLIQSKDAQGNKLIKTAKDNNRSHFFSSVSANTNRGIMNELKDAGIDVFNKNGSFGAKDLNDPDSIAKYYSELGRALDYIVQNTTEAQRAAGGAYNTVYKYLMDEQSALRDDVDSYNDSTDAVNENVNARRKLQAVDFWQNDNNNSMDVSFTFDKVNSAVQTLEDTIDGFDASKLNELLWGTNEGLSDEQAQALANLRKALTDMDFSADTNGVNAFIQALVQVGIVAQSSANGVDALAAGAQKMEDISSKMDEIQSAYKASTSAMEEYNQYGYMSLDSLQSLLTMNTEYLNCLELVNGKLQINKQSYAELLAAEYAEAAATILSNAQHEVANLTADDTAESTDDLKEKTEAEKTALENLLPALKNATAATATYSAAQEFANEVEKAGERGVDPAKLEEITNRTNTQLSLLYTNMNAALKGGQALTNQLNGFGSSSKNAGKSSSTTSKSVADLSSAFDTLTKAMKEYNQYGYISADTTGQYEKEPRDPQVRYYPKQVYNEETKHYETKYIKYDPATDKETELSDPALLVESRVYFIGQSQSHAMTKFVDAMPSAEQIAADKIAEACDNLEYVVVNDPNRTDDLYNSRLTIDKIGRRNLVCSGSEYEGYTSDESAMTVCKYTLWKNCRLTDSITLNMHMIPWLDVNEKVKYAPEYLKSDAEKSNIAVEWIIKKIDKNIGEGTMNVTLSRYYPYYPYITYENVLKEKYTDNTAT